MIDRLKQYWRLRSVREQRLLLAMLALFAITFVWLGLVRPLGDRLAAARERHAQAVLALAAARGQADAIASLQRGPAPPPGMAVGQIVQRAAADAGFTAAMVTPDGLVRAAVAIPAVRPQAFFGWVAELERRYGLVIDRMNVRTNSDATLGVDLTVRSRSG